MLADSVMPKLWAARPTTFEAAVAHDRGDGILSRCTRRCSIASCTRFSEAEPHR